jgi:hypothetical protein
MRDFQRKKIGLIEEVENGPMDSTNGLNGRDPKGSDLLRQSQFSKGSGTKEVDISSDGSEDSSMRILSDDHPLFVVDGDRWVGSSAGQITSILAMCPEKGL